MIGSSEARPGQDGRGSTGRKTPSRDRCIEFGASCLHGRHEHSQGADDPACFAFLRDQLETERPVITVRSAPFIGLRAPRTGGYVSEREHGRYKRATTTSDPGAALTYRPAPGNSGERRWERAQSLFPGLYVLNEQLRNAGRRTTELHWLKDALLGISTIDDLATRSKREPHDVRRAVYAAAQRTCCNDLPRRFRDDRVVLERLRHDPSALGQ